MNENNTKQIGNVIGVGLGVGVGVKNKKDNELRNEFFKYLNSNCKLTYEEEILVMDMNHLIMNGINLQNQEKKEKQEIILKPETESETIKKIESTLKEVEGSKEFLKKVKEEIDESFDKLKVILESRNELSNILKDFNNTSKFIMNEKYKISKLNSSIEKIYKMYEETLSIEAFFENSKEDCVEKIRFTSDYEEIENGISFFTLNSSYIEANKYLNTYNMLKRIAITRYNNYMSQSLQSLFNLLDGVGIEDEFFNFILNFIPKNVDRKFYNFPRNFEKIRGIQTFFEGKAIYDYDVKKSIEGIKQKFIDQRVNILKAFYEEIFSEINKAFNRVALTNTNRKFSDIVYSAIAEISKMTILEIIFFITIFQTKASDNTYILQKLTSDIYNNLYNNLRPIIINSEGLEELFVLFDGLSDHFGVFFLDILEDNAEEVKSRVVSFFSHLSINKNGKDTENQFIDNPESTLNTHMEKIINILKVSKILIRPTILKLIQDVQEKIYFKINSHIKSNFNNLEEDFPNISEYEVRISQNYAHFTLFHFFLRRMAIVLELLKNKLDKEVLNELTVFCIEKFITILNEEILNKKTLTFDFEIYIIGQILLGIKIMEDFEVEGVQVGVDIDFYSITDIFRNNIQNFFTTLNISDIIINSAPKVYDKTRDFKKILFNNLLKGYKILINLVNEYIFGRDIMDVIYKLRNREPVDEKLLEVRIKDKVGVFADLYNRFEKIMNELKTQIRLIDTTIADKLSSTIIENISNNITGIKNELLKYEMNYEEIICMLDKDTVVQNLKNIRDSIFDF